MRKFVALIVILFLVSLVFVPLVVGQGTVDLWSETGVSQSYYLMQDEHPSDSGYYSAAGATFVAQDTAYLYSVMFNMQRTGTITDGFLVAELMGVAGDTSTDTGYPNATLYATSEYVACSEVPTLHGWVTFTFNSTYTVTSGSNYSIQVKYYNGSVSTSNYMRVYGVTTNIANTNSFSYKTGGWQTINEGTYTMGLYVVGSDVENPATPTPPPTTDSTDTTIQGLTDIILPWLVPLLICLIPALLAYKYVGELGFFIGLNIGAILAYVTLANTAYAFPLWGIILVGVMDVAVVLMRR